MKTKISVCIATWNRKKQLLEIIELLEHQTMSRDEYEIIVVDSYSDDGTNQMIGMLQSKYYNLQYIRNAENILAVKRNIGIKKSKGNIIIFLDDDVYPEKEFVETHYESNKNNKNIFYCGQVRFPKELVDSSNYYRFRDQQHLCDDDKGKDLKYNKIVVMNLSFRKEFINQVGYVNEKYIGYGCEDTDFGYRLIEAGYKLKYLPEAKAIHRENSSNIIMYGVKGYRIGLYGIRTLKQECPEAYKRIMRRKEKYKKVLSSKSIKKILEKYLLWCDNKKFVYSYLMYKIYLYSCIFEGINDWKKYPELNCESARKGW